MKEFAVVFSAIFSIVATLLLFAGIRENIPTMMWLGICWYCILPTIVILLFKKPNSIVLGPYGALDNHAVYEVVKKVEVNGMPISFVHKEGDADGVLRVFAEWEDKRAPQKFRFTQGTNGPIGSWSAGFWEIK